MTMRYLNEVGMSNRQPRLLVVDDQPANIQALYQAFSADHQVLMATSGEQALKIAMAKQPDLVLLDVMMPGMDGHEVCHRLKAEESTRDIPVIFVTAHDDEASETLGLELGAVDIISKPINPKIVRARVKTQLTLKAQSDLLRQWVYIDGLTGVYNRRHFDERLASEWARSVRSGTELGIVLLDVDFFKRYNDQYGHRAGDDCLRRLAACLRDSLKRPADLVARYGGEEFVRLLPETPLAGALALVSTAGGTPSRQRRGTGPRARRLSGGQGGDGEPGRLLQTGGRRGQRGQRAARRGRAALPGQGAGPSAGLRRHAGTLLSLRRIRRQPASAWALPDVDRRRSGRPGQRCRGQQCKAQPAASIQAPADVGPAWPRQSVRRLLRGALVGGGGSRRRSVKKANVRDFVVISAANVQRRLPLQHEAD